LKKTLKRQVFVKKGPGKCNLAKIMRISSNGCPTLNYGWKFMLKKEIEDLKVEKYVKKTSFCKRVQKSVI
jgi:hypothetical protein